MATRARSIPRLSPHTVANCLHAAVAAPSVHNTQPWLFRVRGRHFEVWADRHRQLHALDPSGRQMFISVGAAIFNLRIAMCVNGRIPVLRLLPDATRPELAALVQAGPLTAPGSAATVLAAAIARRHTNRRPYRAEAVPWPVLDELSGAAAAEGARLTVAEPIPRDAILALTRAADEILRQDPGYLTELAAWTGGDPRRQDGVPVYAYPPGDVAGRLPLRRFGAAREAATFERRPTILRMTTRGDAPYDWLRAGQALQRVLLTATVRRLAASPINQALEVPELRTLVGGVHGHAQMILRIGYGDPVPATPRRAVSQIFHPDAASDESGAAQV